MPVYEVGLSCLKTCTMRGEIEAANKPELLEKLAEFLENEEPSDIIDDSGHAYEIFTVYEEEDESQTQALTEEEFATLHGEEHRDPLHARLVKHSAELMKTLAEFAKECPEDYTLLRHTNADLDNLRRELAQAYDRLTKSKTLTEAFHRARRGEHRKGGAK